MAVESYCTRCGNKKAFTGLPEGQCFDCGFVTPTRTEVLPSEPTNCSGIYYDPNMKYPRPLWKRSTVLREIRRR